MDVDNIVFLRGFLPSLDEPDESISSKKKNMDDAIANKQFADAEDINGEIEKLQEMFAPRRPNKIKRARLVTPMFPFYRDQLSLLMVRKKVRVST